MKDVYLGVPLGLTPVERRRGKQDSAAEVFECSRGPTAPADPTRTSQAEVSYQSCAHWVKVARLLSIYSSE